MQVWMTMLFGVFVFGTIVWLCIVEAMNMNTEKQGIPTVTLPSTAPQGTRLRVEGITWQAAWEGEHFFWERQN